MSFVEKGPTAWEVKERYKYLRNPRSGSTLKGNLNGDYLATSDFEAKEPHAPEDYRRIEDYRSYA